MKIRKIFALFLSLCLIFGAVPITALAADQTNAGAGIRIQYLDGSYDKTTGIMKVRVQAKMPAGTGISTIGTLLSYDNTKLSLVSQADTNYVYTPADGSDVDTLDDAMKTIMATKTKSGPNRAGSYDVTDGKLYTKDTRTALYTHHANTKSLQYVANDAQTGGDWFDVYEVMFCVAGKPDDPATVLNRDSLRIADVAKGDDAVIKGAHSANNIYSIYLTDDSIPAKLYVLNRMSGCTETAVTGEKSLMTAPETGTATYPGSTNKPPLPALEGAVTLNSTAWRIGTSMNVGTSGITSTSPGTLTYEWYRVDNGGEETRITAASGNSYTPSEAADVGKKIKVKVFAENYSGYLEAISDSTVSKKPYDGSTVSVKPRTPTNTRINMR